MQQGYIFKRGKSWVMKFYEPFIGPDGQPGKRRVLKRLAPVCREYQTATSVEHLAADLLAPINSKVARPSSLETLKEFMDNRYLPMCKAGRKPSTYHSYIGAWGLLEPFVGKRLALRNVRPSDVATILKALADDKPRAQTTLHNCRNLLSRGLPVCHPDRRLYSGKSGHAC